MNTVEVTCQQCGNPLDISEDGQHFSCVQCGAEWVEDGAGGYNPSPGAEEFSLQTFTRRLTWRLWIGYIGMILSGLSCIYFLPAAMHAPGKDFLPMIYIAIPVVLIAVFGIIAGTAPRVKGVKVRQ